MDPSDDEDSQMSSVEEDDQPDKDTIKMFVGQVPKNWWEPELRKLFGQFGRIYSLNVLRDKETNVSRGQYPL